MLIRNRSLSSRLFLNAGSCALVLMLVLSTAAAKDGGASGDKGVNIVVSFLDCSAGAGKKSVLHAWVRNLQTHKVVVDRSTPPTTSLIKSMEFVLAPGAFNLLIGSLYCSQTLDLVVPDQPSMAVTLFGSKAVTMLENATSLAGSLPLAGTSVAIVYKQYPGGRRGFVSPDGYYEVPAIVDGPTYYAASLPSGDATIRLYDSAHDRWLDVATIGLDYRSFSKRYVQHDISAADILGAQISGP
jgi:hypothetical protein